MNKVLICLYRELAPKDKTCRILSLDDEFRNEELCDLTVNADGGAARAAEAIAAAVREAYQ